MARNRNDRRRYGTAAEELVTKLEALAAAATAEANDLARHVRDVDEDGGLDDLRRLTELVERGTNYAHAATLARNLLEVPS